MCKYSAVAAIIVVVHQDCILLDTINITVRDTLSTTIERFTIEISTKRISPAIPIGLNRLRCEVKA